MPYLSQWIVSHIFALHTQRRTEKRRVREKWRMWWGGEKVKFYHLISVWAILLGIPYFSKLSKESDICNFLSTNHIRVATQETSEVRSALSVLGSFGSFPSTSRAMRKQSSLDAANPQIQKSHSRWENLLRAEPIMHSAQVQLVIITKVCVVRYGREQGIDMHMIMYYWLI